MLSPSKGFLFCLPVRLGALVVSLLSFLGSGILFGFTFHSLAIVSAHITPIQTAAFYLASVSWISLSLFSLLGFISVILQHPLLLTIFARFVIFHLPANLLCNIFFTIVLFHSYRNADAVLRSPQCGRGSQGPLVCGASTSLQTLTWLYVFILLPAAIAQTYIYVIVKRFIFVISGEWELEQEHAREVQKRAMNTVGKFPDPKRRTTITQSIGHGGRRRAKAQLWFTMETPSLEAGESFLPTISLSSMAFQSPPRTPFSVNSGGLPASPSPFTSFKSPRAGNQSLKSSLRPLPASSDIGSAKSGASDRSARLDMDFSDPDPGTVSRESLKHGTPSPAMAHEGSLHSKEMDRNSDSSVYSVESLRASSKDGL